MPQMRLAFATGALAAGVAAGALAALAVWLVDLLAANDVWSVGRWLVLGLGLAIAVLTFVGERIAHARTVARMRAIGEPWAYRR
jgi:hypothetical protein